MTTGISWCDETWNPVVGCSKVSAGCAHCYAKSLHDKRHKAYLAGKKMPDCYAQPFETVRCYPDRLEIPLRLRAPRVIFVNSVSDLYHPNVPDEFIDQVKAVEALCPQHTFVELTKRPERMAEYSTKKALRWAEIKREREEMCYEDECPRCCGDGAVEYIDSPDQWGEDCPTEKNHWIPCPECRRRKTEDAYLKAPLPNVFLGVSVEDQPTADERLPYLMKLARREAAWNTVLSIEPLLGPITFRPKASGTDEIIQMTLADKLERYTKPEMLYGLKGVIVGGESGPHARPCNVEWIRSIRDQCAAAAVPCYVKQMGSVWAKAQGWKYFTTDGEPLDSAGANMVNWPLDLRVRELPWTVKQKKGGVA
ncbi:MAG: DUF5131 family protein [Bryobacteraceae bacterium]